MSTCSREKYPLKVYFIFYFGKIIGLCPLSLKENKSEKFHLSKFGIFYTIFLCTLLSIFFYINISYRFKVMFSIESIVSAFWDRFLQVLQYTAIIVTWLNFGFRQKKLTNIIHDFERTCEIARNLGIESDNYLIVRLITWNSLFISILYLFLWNIELYINSLSSGTNLTLWAINSIFRILYHNVLFLFITILHIIYRRFRRLNIHLKCFIVFHKSSPSR